MKLKTLIINEAEIKRELFIGRELEILDEKVLLLALQEGTFCDDEGETEAAAKLVLLHESIEEEDEWDDEDELLWDDDEELEGMTRRQELLEMMDDSGELDLQDACELQVNGTAYTVYDTNEKWMEDQPYDALLAIKRAAEAGAIPESWMEKDCENLYMVEYTVDPAMFDEDWSLDIMSLQFDFMAEGSEVLVGKVMKLPCGRLDVPVAFSLNTPAGDELNVEVYGTYLLDIWKDAACLDLDFSDLEEICARDEKLLVVEYSVDAEVDAALNFYTKDFLDAPADDEEPPMLLLGTEDHELRLLEVVPGDYNGEVELELLSYEVFEE